MEDLKNIIAENISSLRRDSCLTQAELADKLNYSDKAISKWERGESVPDIGVLKELSDLFGVNVDYLITKDHTAALEEKRSSVIGRRKTNCISITCMSVILVWLVATLAFVIVDITSAGAVLHWLAFVYAVPASLIVWLVFNSIWFNTRRNFLIISLLMWTTLASLHLTLVPARIYIWQIYGLGVPGQAIILLWSRLRGVPKD